MSLPEIHPRDVRLGDPFRVTCESVESIHAITGIADDTEMIVVKVPERREQS